MRRSRAETSRQAQTRTASSELQEHHHAGDQRERERDVAKREAEVATREAALLAGAPGGIVQPTPAPCPICPVITEMPVQTVVKEVVREESLTPPGWWDQARIRAEDILDRELKIAEREREISRREEAVNRREHDASRRENWIMEQLV